MSFCRFCGEKTGWFSDVHAACVTSSQLGCQQIASLISTAVTDQLIPHVASKEGDDCCSKLVAQVWSEVKPTVDRIMSEHRVPTEDAHRAMVQGWSTGTEGIAFAEPIAADRVAAMNGFYRIMGLTDDEIKKTDGHMAMACSSMLWFVMVHGDPARFASKERHPFNLRTGEIPLLFLSSVVYSKETVTSSYQGSYGGVSVRVARGIYYHVGGFKGHRIESVNVKQLDAGCMLLTTQHIYFGGAHTNFRIPYEQVISFRPYADGIGVFRDRANAKGEFFRVLESGSNGSASNARLIVGWLMFNLAHFLAQPEARLLYAAKTRK